MDYSYCSKMFTPNQRTRMRNAATSSVSGRNQLWTTTNLAFTGATEPLVLCSAKFTTAKTVICAGETIDFEDQSFNVVNGWNWTFTGGSPATSTVQNPSVTYSTPGTYTVSLVATDGSSNDTETITNYITVLPAGEETLPFFEGFENETNLSTSSRWILLNNGGNTWEVTTAAAHSGVKSAKINNFGQAADQIDELISKTIDLSNVDTVTLSFRYAYRKRNSSSSDYLRVFLTNDCASTWDIRKTLSATNMSGSTTASTAWTPTANDWVTLHMTNVTSQYWVENFRFKFQFESGAGNNVYLDDINIYESLPSDNPVIAGLEETEVNGINLYPNPADDEVNVTFNAAATQDIWVSVTDVTGKVIERHLIHGKAGANLVALNTDAYANGVYFVNLASGNVNQTLQFVIK
jgi:PKD repeat protein